MKKQFPLLVASFFENTFAPIKRPGASTLSHYRTAVRWLADAIGREPTIADLTPSSMRKLYAAMDADKIGPSRQSAVRKRLERLWLYAYRLGLTKCYDTVPMPGARKPAPLAEPGTVKHFFETVFVPERLIACARGTTYAYRATFHNLQTHFQRDIRIDEQTDALAAEHCAWLVRRGLQSVSVNHYQDYWFSVWRYAHEKGLIDRLPSARKLPEALDEPDAWLMSEARRIIRATSVLRSRPPIAGIPADKFFRAFLLVSWWSGLRRSSVTRLKRADVCLQTGWLNVRGEVVKNLRGRRYRLGADALEAIRQIWLPERELLCPWSPLNWRHIYKYLNPILDAARVRPSTRRRMNKFHKWRRTVGTQAAIRGGLQAAIAILNHSGPDLLKRYIDPTQLPGTDGTKTLPSLTEPRRAGSKKRRSAG